MANDSGFGGGYMAQRGGLSTWVATLGPPAAWLAAFIVNYFMTGLVCRDSEWPLHLVFALAGIVIVVSGWLAWNIREETGEHDEAPGGTRLERSRFVGNLGLLTSGLFGVFLIAQWIGVFMFDACARL